jgi:hypothetical protein
MRRFLVALGILTALMGAAVLRPANLAGQSAAAKKPWTLSRTPWGEPDLQGKWSYATITPLERPNGQASKEVLTGEEVAALNEGARTDADRRDGGADADLARAYNAYWYDRGKSIGRTSLIIDPPDGRLPELTAEGRRRIAASQEAERTHPYDSWEDRPLQERCIVYHGVPPLPTGYNNTYEIFQTPGSVVILDENIHDVRVIPLDGRPHLPPSIRQWNGDRAGTGRNTWSWRRRTTARDHSGFGRGRTCTPSALRAWRRTDRFRFTLRIRRPIRGRGRSACRWRGCPTTTFSSMRVTKETTRFATY